MNVNKNWILLSILICISVFAGFLIAKMLTIPGLTVDTKINPLHALSIITSIFVAILVTIYFNRENDKLQRSKQLIIGRISAAFEVCDNLHCKIVDGQVDYATVVSGLKRINIICNCIYNLSARVNIKISIAKANYEAKIKAINALMTDTPIVGTEPTAQEPIKIENGIIKYSKERISEVETQIDQLKNTILELQVELIQK